MKTTQTTNFSYTAKYKLFQSWTKQKDMRVSIGKGLWCNYNPYNTTPEYNTSFNLREILRDEIVIEFDTDFNEKAWKSVNFTCINLLRAGFTFEVYDHKGKSPHIHIRNLPIEHLEKKELREFKKFFLNKFVPKESLSCVDKSLTGVHMIAIEHVNHWKKKYGVKRLLHKFTPDIIERGFNDYGKSKPICRSV